MPEGVLQDVSVILILKNLSISKKILLGFAFSNLLLFLIVTSVAIYSVVRQNENQLDTYRQESMNLVKRELSHLVESSVTILSYYHQKELSGELSHEEAMQKALDLINKNRYDEGRGYFWINDMSHPISNMILHPVKPELNGKPLDKPAFLCAMGKKQNLFQAMVEVCQKSGSGFVDYDWPDPKDKSKILPKVSYVQLFSPWQMVIGTGVYIDDIDHLVATKESILNEALKQQILWMLSTSSLGFIVILLFVYLLVNGLKNRLNTINQKLQEVSDGKGDLTIRIKDSTTDEVGSIAQAFDLFSDNLASLIISISSHVKGLKISAQEMHERSVSVATSTEEMSNQANMVSSNAQEASNSIDQIATMAESIMANSNQVSQSFSDVSSTMKNIELRCSDESRLAIQATNEANNAAYTIQILEEAALKIGSVVDTIEDIAEQTNLLALNATIEASTAGEAGKGFAVVASEVKELSRQTAAATQEISQQIIAVQKKTEDSQKAIQSVTTIIAELNQISSQILQAIQTQSSSVSQVNQQMDSSQKSLGDMVKLIQKSSESLRTISSSIQSVSEVAIHTVQDMELVKDNSSKVNQMSNQINDKISTFKT